MKKMNIQKKNLTIKINLKKPVPMQENSKETDNSPFYNEVLEEDIEDNFKNTKNNLNNTRTLQMQQQQLDYQKQMEEEKKTRRQKEEEEERQKQKEEEERRKKIEEELELKRKKDHEDLMQLEKERKLRQKKEKEEQELLARQQLEKQNQQDKLFKEQQLEEERQKRLIEKEIQQKQKKQEQEGKPKLIEQNIKLKSQLKELAKALDDIVYKEKLSKHQKLHHSEVDEDLLLKQEQLKASERDVVKLKTQIQSLKRQLDNTYDISRVVDKENELKYWQQELDKVCIEQNALNNIKHEQSKALRHLRNGDEYETKLGNLRTKLTDCRKEQRETHEKLLKREKYLRDNHQQLVDLETRVKDLQSKIKIKKEQRKMDESCDINISRTEIDKINEKIKKLEAQKTEIEQEQAEKQKQIEEERRSLQIEHEKKLTILKEREQDLKLIQIKVKEIARLARYKLIAEQQARKEQQSQITDIDKNPKSKFLIKKSGLPQYYKPQLKNSAKKITYGKIKADLSHDNISAINKNSKQSTKQKISHIENKSERNQEIEDDLAAIDRELKDIEQAEKMHSQLLKQNDSINNKINSQENENFLEEEV
ncbi:hypothetical protein PPERSA_06669 [Pseudocohnilembus persalinus]|uniref:Uncharacterized protein n=1 Tax=Pseudocohnilembus persalinus TaxID=266149 RepID=A0A0V0QRX7_PSEPJ|nr:hypothetical protein PPERSA_06669 [Pseudocohnilembus persalinus]|eukprot:KRX05035.1 hypothetical protein PPERSA_06669 [Pseudocohnilembus persalinus]